MYSLTSATQKITRLTKRIRVVQGGTSASKTISILLYLIACAQSDTVPTITSVVSESIPHLKRGAMRDFKKIMQEHGYWKDSRWNVQDSTYLFETGSQLEFFSTDNGDKMRGARRDRGFMNEANNCTRDAFEQMEVRTKEFFFVDYNPTTDFWIYEIMRERTDVEFIVLTYVDNEALDPAIRASIEQRKSRAGWWKVYGLGQLGDVEGKIYKGWQIVDEVPFEARLERYFIDFGYSVDPCAIGALYYYNGGYIVDELAYQLEMSNRMIYDTIANQTRSALVIADSAEPKSIAELKLMGLNILPCIKGADSVNFGIKVVQGKQMSITKRSVNGIKEYRNYLWMTDKDGKILDTPEPGNDHFLDGARYGVTSLVKLEHDSLSVHIPDDI